MDRADYEEQGEACQRSPLCQLIGDHPLACDPRTERQRFQGLFQHFDELDATGLDDRGPELEEMIDASARTHMACALAGGRTT